MISANTQEPEVDFEFQEDDLRHDSEPAMRAAADEHVDVLDAARPPEDDLYQEVVDHDPSVTQESSQANFFAKYGLYIVVGVVSLTLLGMLGWVAVKVLSPAPAHVQRSSTPEPFDAQAEKPQPHKNSGLSDPMQFGDEPTKQSQAPDQHHQETFTASTADYSQGVLPVTPRTEQEQDEQFYDTLVSAAERNPTPPPSVDVASPTQAMTPVQVNPEMADKFAAISVAIANQGKEMDTVLEAVKSVSAEIKALKAQVDASSTKTNLFEGKLNQLNLNLNDLSKVTESRFNEISKAAVAAAVQAVKKESYRQTGGKEKLVLVGGPIKSDYATDKSKRNEKVARPKPILEAARPPVTAAPQAAAKPQAQPENGNQAAKCGATTISQVWKVKGLTYSGAYVRRDDGSALMLRADMEVPGFGRVKSFDPESRTVCTTSGLIAR